MTTIPQKDTLLRVAASFYELTDIVPPAWREWFYARISESAPFSWGDNNRTLVTTGRLLDHLDDVIGNDLEDFGVLDSEWDQFTSLIKSLGELDEVYIDLEH
jgi:hypothetical protein